MDAKFLRPQGLGYFDKINNSENLGFSDNFSVASLNN